MSRQHVACTQFRANFWRPTICAYCYCPKAVHSARKTADRANAEGRRAKSFGSVTQLRIKSSTLQVEQPSVAVTAPTGEAAGPQLPPRSASISELYFALTSWYQDAALFLQVAPRPRS